MDIRQLRYFMAVAEYLNFTEAAKHLFVAQSAVSQQIAELERKIDVQLFIRNKRSVKLTKAGGVLLKEASYLVNKLEEAVEKTRQAKLGIIGSLDIGFLGYTEANFLPSLIQQFRHDYPKINIYLHQFNHETLIRYLRDEELDLVFTFAFGLDDTKGLEVKEIFTEKNSIVMHHRHPLAEKASINISELAKENFIIVDRNEFAQGFSKTLLMCAKGGFTPNIVSEEKFINTILLLVDAGMGISILPKSLELYSTPSLRFIDVDDGIAMDKLIIAWRKDNLNSSIPLFLQQLDTIDWPSI